MFQTNYYSQLLSLLKTKMELKLEAVVSRNKFFLPNFISVKSDPKFSCVLLNRHSFCFNFNNDYVNTKKSEYQNIDLKIKLTSPKVY